MNRSRSVALSLSDAGIDRSFPTTRFTKGVLRLLIFLATTPFVQAQCANLAGKWRINDAGVFPGTMVLSQSGCSISGQIQFDDGEPIQNLSGSATTSTVTFVLFQSASSCVGPSRVVDTDFTGTIPPTATMMSGTYTPQSCTQQYTWTATRSCQIFFPTVPNGYNDGNATYVQYALTQNPTTYQAGVPATFGYAPSPNLSKCRTSQSGCALTMAATMLNSFPPLSVTPASLDSFLTSGPFYGTGPISSSGAAEQCEFTPAWSALVLLNPFSIQMLPSGATVAGSTLGQVNGFLNQQVCTDGNRVILKLADNANSGREHFILVTGQTPNGMDWKVFDGGWGPPSVPSTLGGHLAGFNDNGGTFHQFQVTGARVYAAIPTLPTSITITANSPVELLISDPNGRRLGSNSSGQSDYFEIPLGSYLRDGIQEDPTTGGAANGDPTEIKTAYIPAPLSGTYQIVATGTAAGSFRLTFRTVASDSSLQSTSFTGITNTGGTSTYVTKYSPRPGSAPSVSLMTSSYGTIPPSQISTTASGLAYSRATQTFNGTLTIKNVGPSTISGPLQVVFTSLPPGVTLANSSSVFAGFPFLTLPSTTSLAPTQSVTVSLQFKNPSNAVINTAPLIYSGTLN